MLAFCVEYHRSIPAHAGQTPSSPEAIMAVRVDPRSRGADSPEELVRITA